MADNSGGATTEKFILSGQKSANQLRALLANLLPAAEAGGGTESSGAAVEVEALLSDISDSLCGALASLRLGALCDQRLPAPPPGQGNLNGGDGGARRSTPRRTGQRMRVDGACRTILQNGDYDSYSWRKYGQKEILGAKFARSYFKCARKSELGCWAKKQVQPSDADPSVLEITYIGAHSCDEPLAWHSVPDPISSGTQRSGDHLLPPVATVPTTPQTAGHRHVTAVPATVMAWTPSMEEEQAMSLLFIPSPACSQSELLSTEVPELIMPDDPPVLMEHKPRGRDIMVSDSLVPEL